MTDGHHAALQECRGSRPFLLRDVTSKFASCKAMRPDSINSALPRCARPTSIYDSGLLPVVAYEIPPARFTPVVSLEVPLLQLLRRGRVLLRTGKGGPRESGPDAGVLHSLQADPTGQAWSSDTGAEYLGLVLRLDACRELLHREPAWASTGRPPLRFLDARLTWWMQELEMQFSNDHPFGRLYTESCQLALISYLDTMASTATRAGRSVGKMLPAGLRRVQAFVHDNLGAALRIEDLAQICDCSPAHLSRMFRSSVGISVHRYVTEQRIQKAKQLLSIGHLGLAEIALVCGFATQAHFGNVFHRYVGTPPARYRDATRSPPHSSCGTH